MDLYDDLYLVIFEYIQIKHLYESIFISSRFKYLYQKYCEKHCIFDSHFPNKKLQDMLKPNLLFTILNINDYYFSMLMINRKYIIRDKQLWTCRKNKNLCNCNNKQSQILDKDINRLICRQELGICLKFECLKQNVIGITSMYISNDNNKHWVDRYIIKLYL